jgi:hypothetical protein
MVTLRLQEALADARERGAQQLKLDRGFVEAILGAMESRDLENLSLKAKFDGAKVWSVLSWHSRSDSFTEG